MIVLDKMINYKIIEPSSVVSWIFDRKGGLLECNRYVSLTRDSYYYYTFIFRNPMALMMVGRSYVWSLLRTVVIKLHSRIQTVTQKVESRHHTAVTEDAMQVESEHTETNGTPKEDEEEEEGRRKNTGSDKWTSALDELKREQKELFIHVFRSFVQVLDGLVSDSQRSVLEDMMRDFGRFVSCF